MRQVSLFSLSFSLSVFEVFHFRGFPFAARLGVFVGSILVRRTFWWHWEPFFVLSKVPRCWLSISRMLPAISIVLAVVGLFCPISKRDVDLLYAP